MDNRRTFILPTNFHQKPASSAIQLGNIIADPLAPTKILSMQSSPPVADSIVETNHSLTRSSACSLNAGLWTKFLSLVDSKTQSVTGTEITQSFEIDQLETKTLKHEPQDDDPGLISRIKEPKVQAAIRAGLFGTRPVYLISGLKIARGLSVRRETNQAYRGNLSTGIPVVPTISVGVEIGGGSRSRMSSSFKAAEEEDVIFAYQVHIIKVKGRKNESASVAVYESKAAFLHDDGKEHFKVEVKPGSFEALKDEEDEDEGYEIEMEPHKVLGANGEIFDCLTTRDL